MNIIDDNKLSLIAKLIVSYALLLNFAFLFYVFNTDPGSDQTARGAVLTNLLVWTATLFTPISAYFVYDSWKEQKRFEINKEYSENTLNLLNEVNNHINAEYYNHILIKASLEEYLILTTPENKINITNILYKIKPQFETLLLILKDKDSNKYLDEFEKSILHIFAYIKNLNSLYQEYLDSLPPEFLEKKCNYIRRNSDNCSTATTFKIRNYLDRINKDLEIIDIDHINNVEIKITNSYENFKKNYDEKYKNMTNFLIEKITL